MSFRAADTGMLLVEGADDRHALGHFLARHGLEHYFELSSDHRVEIKSHDGVDDLLAGMATRIRFCDGLPLGFVLDADESLKRRWQAVRQRLSDAGVAAPNVPPGDGFVGVYPPYGSNIGVWLMPDNRRDGMLEHFLTDLIDAEDPLIVYAETAAKTARKNGAKFKANHLAKAAARTWLAWQEEPGLPYGTAIKAKYFGMHSEAGASFVAWFRQVFLGGA